MKVLKRVYQVVLCACFVSVFFTLSPQFRTNIKVSIVNLFKKPLETSTQSTRNLKKAVSQNPESEKILFLEKKIKTLRTKLVMMKEFALENDRLRKLLNFKRQSSFKTTAVRIIEKDPSIWRHTVIINKGRLEGLYPNMPAVSSGGLCGIVSEVGKSISRVILINDPNFRVNVFIQRTRDEGVLEGSIEGFCRIKYLPLNTRTKIGDIVITSGLGKIFPKGILIGRVKSLQTDNLGLYMNAEVQLCADVVHLEELLCIAQ